MRNSVTSTNFGPFGSSFKFAPAAGPVLIRNAPAQAPIAATIQAKGEVQLYINFKYDSADIEQSATPTLMELRGALAQDPALRLVLVGHTDTQGAPPYNLALSLRRAQSVMAWLTSQGIEPTRLMIDGKGQAEPIADNATESGRAVNRRVQAIRFP